MAKKRNHRLDGACRDALNHIREGAPSNYVVKEIMDRYGYAARTALTIEKYMRLALEIIDGRI